MSHDQVKADRLSFVKEAHVTTKRPGGSKSKTKKLKLRKETLKDLDARRKGAKIKGGETGLCGTGNIFCPGDTQAPCNPTGDTCIDCRSRVGCIYTLQCQTNGCVLKR